MVKMIEFPKKKYKIIYADPPWSYNSTSKNGTSRGVAEKYYNTMSLKEIKELPINNLADDNSLLFMWITFPHLHEMNDILNSWGFKFKTVAFNWIKVYKHSRKPILACGYWTRSNGEICILATKGKDYPRRISAGISQIVISEQKKHSEKPDEVRKRIVDLVGDLPRIELFSRSKREGWDAWGDQVPKEEQRLLQ